MRTLLFLLLLPVSVFAQKSNFHFFEVGHSENDKDYARVLMPAHIDSVIVIDTFYRTDVEVLTKKKSKALQFEDYRIVDNFDALADILDYLDTINEIVQIQAEIEYLDYRYCDEDNYEWVTETVKMPSYKKWTCTEKDKSTESSSWELETINSEYTQRQKYVMSYPCHPPIERIESKNQELQLVKPNKNLSAEDSIIFIQNTKAFFEFEYDTIIYKIEEKETYSVSYEYRILSLPELVFVEVYDQYKIDARKDLIAEKLIAEQLIGETQKSDKKALEKALLLYQYRNNLPIGQYDKLSIQKLLSQ